MQSTVSDILERSKKSIKNIVDYICNGSMQKSFLTDLDDIDLESGTYLDDIIDANDKGLTNIEILELQQAYSLKRDLHYAYAERSYLFKKCYDKKIGDHFRSGRDKAHMDKTAERAG